MDTISFSSRNTPCPPNCSGFSVIVLIKIVHGDKVYIWRLVPCFYHVLWSEKEAKRLKYKVVKRKHGSSSVSSRKFPRKLSKLGSSCPNFRAKTRLEMLATQASCWTNVNRLLGKIPNRNFLLLRIPCRLATLLPRKDERCVTTQKSARYACVGNVLDII